MGAWIGDGIGKEDANWITSRGRDKIVGIWKGEELWILIRISKFRLLG